MAVYHLVHPKAWNDPWFADLRPHGKLLFLFLLTSPYTSASGLFQCPARKMAHETGISLKQVETLLEEFSSHVEYDPGDGHVWVVKAASYWLDNANVVKAMKKQVEMLDGHPFAVAFRKRYSTIWKEDR